MDAPQFPDADAAQPQAGLQTPGQASAFRRALDAQAAAPEQSRALVPTGPHDLTAPIDVDELRAALAFHTAIDAAQAGMVHAWHAAVSTDVVAIPPAPPGPPSPSGPTVVMPSVAVPVLRVPTTITPTGPSTVQIAMQPGQAVSAQRARQLPTAQPATVPGADPQPAGPGDAG
ncbi:MAG: hypothetical protein ACRDSS_03405, partial [Actinocrinis sp.]